tara:strand:- start:1439 stop:3577 length:2139 start_codon:yes stop_codon:yes gene_type:complete
MKGFKLLGIKTKDRVNVNDDSKVTDYLKVLNENTYYSFYSSYHFNKETETFTYHSEKDVDLYSLSRKDEKGNDNALHINISAIVGENGAGKSTLIELLFLGIHNVAAACKILKDPDNSKKNWYVETGVHIDIFYAVEERIYCIKLRDLDITYSFQDKNKDNSFSKLSYFKEFNKENKKDLELFFYSIAINYSLYGLNSKHIGDWIRGLFHKNDGYQTPIVINPMRSEGEIKINREEHLAKSRLLSNLLIKSEKQNHLKLTNNQMAYALTFKLNEGKIKNIYEEKKASSTNEYTFSKFFENYSSESEFLDLVYSDLIELNRGSIDTKYKEEVEKYIVKKLFKIANTYKKYKGFLTYNSVTNSSQPCFYLEGKLSLGNYLKALKKDNSHITFKLNQAINYIRNNPLFEDKNNIWNTENNYLHISIKELAKRINTGKTSDLINLIPPSLFNLEIHLEEINNAKKKSVFNGLSSGEQQLIHSVQSILYHIVNLNSVFDNNDLEDINYKYINLILDEIELYFHPAHQKDFIQYLLDGIKSLDVPKINAINILFSTHSPFILSDIPSNNILKLKKGEPTINEQLTFGANIHDLLANDFFLKDGFMGEFAKNEIKNVIEALNYTYLSNLQTENENKSSLTSIPEHNNQLQKKIDSIEFKLKGIKQPDVKYTKEYCEKVIKVIGEPILYMSLMELYSLAYKNSKDAFINEQIKKLEDLKK